MNKEKRSTFWERFTNSDLKPEDRAYYGLWETAIILTFIGIIVLAFLNYASVVNGNDTCEVMMSIDGDIKVPNIEPNASRYTSSSRISGMDVKVRIPCSRILQLAR